MLSRYKKLGVIGGLGPLASAAFLRMLYAVPPKPGVEQEWPEVVVVSDPTFPPRTPINLQRKSDEVVARLNTVANSLLSLGCDAVVICCCSAHCVVPELAPSIRQAIISLPDLSLESAMRTGLRQIALFCAEGARVMGVFQRSSSWPAAQSQIRAISGEDQLVLQSVIEGLKLGMPPAEAWRRLQGILDEHRDEGIIFGCTELHIISDWLLRESIKLPYIIIDPLVEIARVWRPRDCQA